jgi:hypothetical protein
MITNGSYAYEDDINDDTLIINNNNSTSIPTIRQSDATVLTTTPIRRRSSICPAPKSFAYGTSIQDSMISYTQKDKRWLSQYDECSWMGVICNDQKQVTYIALGM